MHKGEAARRHLDQVSLVERRDIKVLFERALKTLFALPDRDRPRGYGQGWPAYIREYMDAYDPDAVEKDRFKPTPQDVSTYLDVLSWGRGLDQIARRIVVWKTLGMSFRAMGDALHVSHEIIRLRYEDAVDEIWRAAHSERAGS
jgi:hypothetical protein